MNPLDVLGLHTGDTLENAKKRRNELLKIYHPDKCGGAQEMYDKITEAYESLKANPSLLTSRYFSPSSEFIIVGSSVSIEDFYFRRVKKISFTRNIFCRACGGTGSSEGVSGVCSGCRGTGEAGNDILSLMGDSKCPFCRGTGIKTGKTCRSCGGSRYEPEQKTVSFRLSLVDYHKKTAVLEGVGNQLRSGRFGRLLVNLSVIPDDKVSIEENYFSVFAPVHPVQRIIGDEGEVEIFGRKIKFGIERGSRDAYITDMVSKGNYQCICIKYLDREPRLTHEIEELYRRILQLEASL